MNIEEMRAIIALVNFPEYTFEVFESEGGAPYLQARYLEADIITGAEDMQHTRKWPISAHMVKSELVQTAFKCVLTSMEHRTREHFTYRDALVYGPHFDVEALVEIAMAHRLDYRGRKAQK